MAPVDDLIGGPLKEKGISMLGVSSLDDPRLFAARKHIGLFSNTYQSAKALHESDLTHDEQLRVLSDAREGMRGVLGTALKLTLPVAGAIGGHVINGLRKHPQEMSPEALAGTTAGYVAADEFSNWYARNKIYAIKDHLYQLQQEKKRKPMRKVAAIVRHPALQKVATDYQDINADRVAKQDIGYLRSPEYSAGAIQAGNFSPEMRGRILERARGRMGGNADAAGTVAGGILGAYAGEALGKHVGSRFLVPMAGMVGGSIAARHGLHALRDHKLEAIRSQLAEMDATT